MNVVYISVVAVILLWIFFSFQRKRRRKNKVISVVESNCIGCRRCVKRCPYHVLEMADDETGIHAVVKYPNKCTACGDCLAKCQFCALKIIERG